MRAFLIALAAALSLAGCATKPATLAAAAPAPVTVPPACLGVRAYTADQLQAMAAAVRALPPASPLRDLVVDYQRLRDEARAACAAPARP